MDRTALRMMWMEETDRTGDPNGYLTDIECRYFLDWLERKVTQLEPRGLYGKYAIFKVEPLGVLTPIDGPAFVLRYDRDEAALAALTYYAQQINEKNPELSEDLLREIIRVTNSLKEKNNE